MKGIIIFLAVFFTVLLVGGVLFFMFSEGEKAVNIEKKKDCGSLTSMEERDNCYFNLAVEMKNNSICLNINNSWKKGDCIFLFER